jgi:hypothetical protein
MLQVVTLGAAKADNAAVSDLINPLMPLIDALNRFIQLARINEVSGHGRGRRHCRADQVRAPALPLATLEITVGGRGAALAGRESIIVHA